MAIGTNFLAINCKQFGNNQLFVIDANSPIFYGIYSIIPIERFGFMGISKTTYIPNLYYIQDGQLSVYKIGQTFSNGQTPPTSSPFILSTENEATTWAAV